MIQMLINRDAAVAMLAHGFGCVGGNYLHSIKVGLNDAFARGCLLDLSYQARLACSGLCRPECSNKVSAGGCQLQHH